MGHYTTFSVSLVLKPDAPEAVVVLLKHMATLDGCHDPDDWTNKRERQHEVELRAALGDSAPTALMGCYRWHRMFSWGNSYQTDREFTVAPEGVRVRINRSSIKNYEQEVQKFWKWIQPFCLPQTEPIIESQSEEGPPIRYYADGRATYQRYDDWEWASHQKWSEKFEEQPWIPYPWSES